MEEGAVIDLGGESRIVHDRSCSIKPGKIGRQRWIGAGLLVASLSSCATFTTMLGPVGGWPEARPLPVEGTDLFDWKGMVHCHSYLSHDSSGTIPEIRDAASAARLDFLVMTDHQTDASIRDGVRGRLDDTLFLVGAEVRTPQGTVIAFPLRTPLRRFMSAGALIVEAQRQGAIGIMAHAEAWNDWGVDNVTGVEIVNLHAGALAADPVSVILTTLFLPIRSLMRRISVRDPEIFRHWDEALAARHPLSPVGGGDAHASIRAFGPLGGTIGNYREVFLTVSTHVLATECTEESIVEAFRAGRSYVSFDVFGEGSGFDFRAMDADGVHVLGATVDASESLRLLVRTPSVARIELWRDGEIVERHEGTEFEFDRPEPGIYRVEARTPRDTPWLFSGSIRVTAAEAR
ncbi:MAG: hypothetical protein KDB80_10265 [Planctomycetes bacterium]|nr:hypothetical protein [Planctomycetota bacterium]